MTRYEAVALTLVNPDEEALGEIITGFPPAGSTLNFDDLFQRIYAQYDQRFVYAAPALANRTRQLEWDAGSPVLKDLHNEEFEPRIAV